MGRSTMEGLADASKRGLIKREIALKQHIGCNFYPPHPEYVVKSMLAGFRAYWKGDLGLEGLQEKCYLRTIDGLYKYFEFFLNEEDRL